MLMKGGIVFLVMEPGIAFKEVIRKANQLHSVISNRNINLSAC